MIYERTLGRVIHRVISSSASGNRSWFTHTTCKVSKASSQGFLSSVHNAPEMILVTDYDSFFILEGIKKNDRITRLGALPANQSKLKTFSINMFR